MEGLYFKYLPLFGLMRTMCIKLISACIWTTFLLLSCSNFRPDHTSPFHEIQFHVILIKFILFSVNFDHFQILRAIGKGSFGKVSLNIYYSSMERLLSYRTKFIVQGEQREIVRAKWVPVALRHCNNKFS